MRATYSTKPREQVSAVLRREKRYLSAAEIHAILRKSRTNVSLSTVYRTLDLLAGKGEASARVDERGETTFVVCDRSHHHHAVCNTCGKVEDVSCEAIESVAHALRSHHGFKLADHEMEFFGTCGACR
ncbi:MAG TPA: transcriptional repressor [Candidatus Rubrimentiphilum sp.]|nr:transcriptional repressor [Candidatus Rubrimentiphilum sp.]